MFLDVRLRPKQALLFAAPKGHPDRPTRLRADRFENSCRLHHHRAADGVISRSGSRMPRVEVPAEHHDLVRLIATRDLRDDVVRRRTFREKFISNVELESDGCALAQHSCDTSKIFVSQDNGRRSLFRIGILIAERAY